MNKNWQEFTAVVTGASAGIGAAIARRLARAGMRVTLVARRPERLTQVANEIRAAGGLADALPADLTVETERRRVFEQVLDRTGAPQVLVNNAGAGWYGYTAEMPWETARQLLELNTAAAVHLSLLFLPGMLGSDRGHIINIGSVVGSLPSQGVALYGATKAFLDHFTSALQRELAGTGVHASVVRAGAVTSDFCAVAARQPGGMHLPTERMGVTPEKVAGAVWNLLQRPRPICYVPAVLAFTPWVDRLFGPLIDRLGPLLLRRQKARLR